MTKFAELMKVFSSGYDINNKGEDALGKLNIINILILSKESSLLRLGKVLGETENARLSLVEKIFLIDNI